MGILFLSASVVLLPIDSEIFTRILTVILYGLLGVYSISLLVMNVTHSYPTGRSALLLQVCPYTVVAACLLQGWFLLSLFIALMAFPRFIALAALIQERNKKGPGN